MAGTQFPVKDPSAGRLADAVSLERPRSEDAARAAAGARRLAMLAMAGAALAVVAAIGVGLRTRAR